MARKSHSTMLENDSTETKKNSSKESSSDSKSLNAMFEEGLKSAYSIEHQLIEALPEMAKAAYSEELHDAFMNHLEQTKRHAQRIEKIFALLEIESGEETCKVMQSLIEEGKNIISEYKQGPVRDSAIIIAAQKVEHHEIATYGSLFELADVLGHTKVRDLLDRTLGEEESTDRVLTNIAQTVNDEALEMSKEMA